MASLKKFSDRNAIVNQLRHNQREIQNSSNPDINYDRTNQNYSLLPSRDISDYHFFKNRLSEVTVYNRPDVIKLAGWIVTLPDDVPSYREEDFFELTNSFLLHRYGEKNAVQSIVHKDESGRPHIHFLFIPICQDKKHPGAEKVCANEVLSRQEYWDFHPALSKWMEDHGLPCTIKSGITRERGGNRTVKQLKKEREMEIEKCREKERVELIEL